MIFLHIISAVGFIGSEGFIILPHKVGKHVFESLQGTAVCHPAHDRGPSHIIPSGKACSTPALCQLRFCGTSFFLTGTVCCEC